MATVDVEEAPFWGTRLATSDIGGCKFEGAELGFDTDHGEQYPAGRETLALVPIATLRSFRTFCLRILSTHATKAPWKVYVS